MERPHLRERRQLTPRRPRHERLMRTVVVAGIVASVGGIALLSATRGSSSAQADGTNRVSEAVEPAPAVTAQEVEFEPTGTLDTAVGDTAVEDAAGEALPDLVEPKAELTDDCEIPDKTMSQESESVDVQCLQQALQREGFYNGELTGQLDQATTSAVTEFQEENDLFVDGVPGRETGMALDIWPEEKLEVVRTPPPPPGAKDSWGFELSPVSSIGDDAPPLPENSGSGKRVVYEKISQRVWAVDDGGEIIRSWLVSGSLYDNEPTGTFEVFSRSDPSTAWNGKAYLPMMIRWYKTEIGNLGFHGIPTKVSDGSPYQTTDELGTRLSGGCQRQANEDAAFMWAFAEVGTKVVVL